jgi:hypothetical protein
LQKDFRTLESLACLGTTVESCCPASAAENGETKSQVNFLAAACVRFDRRFYGIYVPIRKDYHAPGARRSLVSQKIYFSSFEGYITRRFR